jgi:hypothetical protein
MNAVMDAPAIEIRETVEIERAEPVRAIPRYLILSRRCKRLLSRMTMPP